MSAARLTRLASFLASLALIAMLAPLQSCAERHARRAHGEVR